jgi:D-inositol-3-phosphate glycosyltransferase
MNSTRVMMISEHASPLKKPGTVDSGGQNVYVAHLMEELCRLGYRVDVFTRREGPDPLVVSVSERARVIHIPAGPARHIPKEQLLEYMPEFTRLCGVWMERERYDLMHANFFMSGLVAADLKAEWGVPFVITFHALGRVRRMYQREADKFPDDRFAIEQRLIENADRIFAECLQDYEDLVTLYDADPVRVSIVPCGVNTETFHRVPRAEARRRVGVGDNEKVILQLGRIVPRKGIANVIEAVALLKHEHNCNAKLLVVGGESEEGSGLDSPEIKRLQGIAQERDVVGNIIFAGRRNREELRYYYSAADIFVTTPLYEPFGITPLEAMACGTPVIGSNVGGIKYTVRNGETGYLVPPESPKALAEQLHLLLQEEEEGTLEFSDRAQQRILRHFTWEHIARQCSSIYEAVLNEAQVVDEQDPQAPRSKQAVNGNTYLNQDSIG